MTCLSLKDPSIRGTFLLPACLLAMQTSTSFIHKRNAGVRVGATWNLLSEDGVLITSRHEKLTPILLTPDPGDDPQLGKGRGYTNFYRCVRASRRRHMAALVSRCVRVADLNIHCRPSAELETFTLTCDFVIREVVREDGSSSGTSVRRYICIYIHMCTH